MSPRSLRTATRTMFALSLLAAASCGSRQEVRLVVRNPPGDQDPFATADTVRVQFVGDGTDPMETPITGTRAFGFELSPSNQNAAYRVRIEAVRAGTVVGVGVTPPVVWSQLAGTSLVVFVQPRDSLVRPPGATRDAPPARLSVGRAEFQLRAAGAGVVAVTLPNGATDGHAVDGYDLLAHQVNAYTQTVPFEFDGATDVIPVAGAYLLHRAGLVGQYTNADAGTALAAPLQPVPVGRTMLRSSTVIEDTTSSTGGAWLLGGRADAGPSTRVDRVNSEQLFSDPPPAALAVARERPAVIDLTFGATGSSPKWLVAFGQRAGEGAFEVYEPGAAPLPVRFGDPAIDLRTGGAVCCVEYDDFGCSRMVLLGGRLADGSLAPRDAVINAACLREVTTSDASRCYSAETGGGAWLSSRRYGHTCALAEGGRVLVAGGTNGTAPIRTLETVDVTVTTAPIAGRVLMETVAADPALLQLTDGSVMVAGGRDADGRASTDLWIYRY